MCSIFLFSIWKIKHNSFVDNIDEAIVNYMKYEAQETKGLG